MIADYEHPKGNDEELELLESDIVCVLEKTSDDWYYVTKDGETCGFVASSFLSPYEGELPEHLQCYSYINKDSQTINTKEDENKNQETKTEPISSETHQNEKIRAHRSHSSASTIRSNQKLQHNDSQSRISTRIKAGSKFLKKKRKSVTLSSSKLNLKRQDTSPMLQPKPKIMQTQRRYSDGDDDQRSLPTFLLRGRILKELLTTERQYIHILEVLVNVSSPKKAKNPKNLNFF